MMSHRKKYIFEFVNPGTVAPKILSDCEIWLDVGDRFGDGVFDHHHGNRDARSASELILHNFRGGAIEPLEKCSEIKMVLHQNPDIDAICSAWLVRDIIEGKLLNEESLKTLEKLVDSISKHDQGIVCDGDPRTNWMIVVNTLLATDPGSKCNMSRLKLGWKALDRIFSILAAGGNVRDAAADLMTARVREALLKAEDNYHRDLARGKMFQARLPFSDSGKACANGQSGQSDVTEKKWVMVDGLYVDNPTSVLFKELARNDKINSPSKSGFGLLVAAWDIADMGDRIIRRYIISTDPRKGMNLIGLGERLEKLEQVREDRLKLPLLGGRERVGFGKGRYGYNVKSPWYDGRGHDYTIVDSPSIKIEGEDSNGSCLDGDEVLHAVKTLIE